MKLVRNICPNSPKKDNLKSALGFFGYRFTSTNEVVDFAERKRKFLVKNFTCNEWRIFELISEAWNMDFILL